MASAATPDERGRPGRIPVCVTMPSQVPEPLTATGIAYRGRRCFASKGFWHGTQRTVCPEETLGAIQPHLKAIGVTRIAEITGLDRVGIPVTLAIRPNSPTLVTSAGKGLNGVAARVSAAMEAIELHYLEQLRLPEFIASYEELDRYGARIPIDRLPLTKYSLFRPTRPFHWMLGWDLIHQEEVAVPSSTIEFVPRARRDWELDCFQNTSNGLASGNHFLEATAFALCEVIERDAVACHHTAESCGRTPPRVRPETIEHALARELIATLKRAAVEPVLFDLTVDTAVPVFMTCLYDRHHHLGIFKGYGAHLDPQIAMIRALTEAVQSRLVFISGSRDDLFARRFRTAQIAADARTIRALREGSATVDAREQMSQATPTFEGDVQLLLEKLRRVGLNQVIVFDLAQPGVPVAAVKVLVPGLEGYPSEAYQPGARARAFGQAATQ
jgi:YcaO-like protein with predicted kinase domain